MSIEVRIQLETKRFDFGQLRHRSHCRRNGTRVGGRSRRLSGEPIGEPPQTSRPSAVATDRLANLQPAIPMPLEVTMLEVDARAIRPFGREPHFDFACPRRILLDLPLRVDIP